MEPSRKAPAEPLTPSRVWSELGPQARVAAARSVYAHPWEDDSMRAEADLAIAAKLRFRLAAVRKLPVARRIDYLAKAVRPDDGLAATLLRALHLAERTELLGAFLDEIGVPHQGGVIDSDHVLDLSDRARLRQAIERLRARFPPSDVDVYLNTLLALDPVSWGPIAEVHPLAPAGGAAGE
jgi:hypothetical protein